MHFNTIKNNVIYLWYVVSVYYYVYWAKVIILYDNDFKKKR